MIGLDKKFARLGKGKPQNSPYVNSPRASNRAHDETKYGSLASSSNKMKNDRSTLSLVGIRQKGKRNERIMQSMDNS